MTDGFCTSLLQNIIETKNSIEKFVKSEIKYGKSECIRLFYSAD